MILNICECVAKGGDTKTLQFELCSF